MTLLGDKMRTFAVRVKLTTQRLELIRVTDMRIYTREAIAITNKKRPIIKLFISWDFIPLTHDLFLQTNLTIVLSFCAFLAARMTERGRYLTGINKDAGQYEVTVSTIA